MREERIEASFSMSFLVTYEGSGHYLQGDVHRVSARQGKGKAQKLTTKESSKNSESFHLR